MKSRKYNKFRKNRKKTQKKVYKKTEKKVKKRKYNRKKTYRKNGGAKELCKFQSDDKPNQNISQQKKCNEYFFIKDTKKYAWRNPILLSGRCKKQDTDNNYKSCVDGTLISERNISKSSYESDSRRTPSNERRPISEIAHSSERTLSKEKDLDRQQKSELSEPDKRWLDQQKRRQRNLQRSSNKSKIITFELTEKEKAERRIKKQELENQLKIINDELKKLQDKYNAIDTSSLFASDYKLKINQKEELHTEIREKESEKSNIENSISFLHI